MQKVSIVKCFRASKRVRATLRLLHSRDGSESSAGAGVATPNIVAAVACIYFTIILLQKKRTEIDLTRSRCYHNAHEPNFASNITNLFAMFFFGNSVKSFFFFARFKF